MSNLIFSLVKHVSMPPDQKSTNTGVVEGGSRRILATSVRELASVDSKASFSMSPILALSQSIKKKSYLLDRQPFLKHFQPYSLTKVAIKSIVIQSLIVLPHYIEQILEEDDDDEEDEDQDIHGSDENQITTAELPSIKDFSIACSITFVKSLSVTTMTRILEAVALDYFTERFAGKFMKDISKSALRKYARSSSKYQAGQLMLKTGAKANLLVHLAIFLVEEIHQIILLIRRQIKSKKAKNEAEMIALEDEANFWMKTLSNLGRCGGSIVAGALGGAIGTMVRPGTGTIVGALIGDSLVYAL